MTVNENDIGYLATGILDSKRFAENKGKFSCLRSERSSRG